MLRWTSDALACRVVKDDQERYETRLVDRNLTKRMAGRLIGRATGGLLFRILARHVRRCAKKKIREEVL
jgi:hypothetical protein